MNRTSPDRILFSAAEPFLAAASDELRALPRVARVQRLAPDLGLIEIEQDGDGFVAVSSACREGSVVFVRHLARLKAVLTIDGSPDAVRRIGDVLGHLLADHGILRNIALQAWSSGPTSTDLRAEALRRYAADLLEHAGIGVARSNQDHILSICLTPKSVLLGLNERVDALSDWPGGRVRLAKDPLQISRSEFKLEELLKLIDLPLPSGGVALDLGASPGGWSRVLRRLGLTVWAVDPADLHPSLAADAGVHHVRTTAAPFLRSSNQRFDLITNDMRMLAPLSCELMLAAARRLKPNGLAVVTLKLPLRDPLATVRFARATLERSYRIVFARQLYHNRNEITVVVRPRSVG